MLTRIYLCFETRSLPALTHVLPPTSTSRLCPSMSLASPRLRSLAASLAVLPSMSLIPSSSIVLIRGNHEPFNRLALYQSIHDLGDVGDRDAPVKKVIGFD
jgi:hypothetical protein